MKNTSSQRVDLEAAFIVEIAIRLSTRGNTERAAAFLLAFGMNFRNIGRVLMEPKKRRQPVPGFLSRD